jgi:hypothetical protein
MSDIVSDKRFWELFDTYEELHHEGRTAEMEAFEREHGGTRRADGTELREMCETLRKLGKGIRRELAEAMQPPPDLTERILRRLREERGRQ